MSKCVLVLLLIPFLLSACSPNNVTVDNSFEKYFDSAGVRGTFGMFDNGQGHFTIYDLSRYRDSAYLPASTFEIVSSLIGIQTGVVKDDSAFGNLAGRIGKDTMQKWIDTLGYGNKDLSGPLDSLGLNDRLRITADEELGLVKKLYFDQLPFFLRTQRIVRGMMLREDNANYKLSYKTGWGRTKDGRNIGWVVGWIEENKHPYFFVLNLESADARAGVEDTGMQLLRSILKQMGFFEGKK